MRLIKVNAISKVYKLYNKPQDRLKEAINPFGKKYHKDFYALRNINFDVENGECVGIIGVNGSGKSTLLKIISGVLTQTNGQVIVNGRISSILELGSGFNPEYTGIENIYLNGTIMGYSKEQIKDRMYKILEFADIGDFVYQPIKNYSSGMFARLSFAVAINIDPDILIVDEALSVGDIFFQAKCFNKFREFIDQGKTVLFVSHDLSSILKYCNRAILLNGGEMVMVGNTKDVVEKYKKILVNIDCEEQPQVFEEHGEGELKNHLRINESFIEYGNNKATIYDVGLKNHKGVITNLISVDEFLEIVMKVRFNDCVKNPIFAFMIKDVKGVEVMGTNTALEGIDTGIYNEGDTAVVTFRQRVNLNSMEWLVSFGCTGFEKDDFVVYNRKYDYIPLNILSSRIAAGYVNPCCDVSIEATKK